MSHIISYHIVSWEFLLLLMSIPHGPPDDVTIMSTGIWAGRGHNNRRGEKPMPQQATLDPSLCCKVTATGSHGRTQRDATDMIAAPNFFRFANQGYRVISWGDTTAA